MLKRFLALILPLSTLLSASEFEVGKSAFSLDDKPFQIRSGEIHYSRVPRAEWRSRIQMAKSMGLNTISNYVR
jgi:beta-galactosidase